MTTLIAALTLTLWCTVQIVSCSSGPDSINIQPHKQDGMEQRIISKRVFSPPHLQSNQLKFVHEEDLSYQTQHESPRRLVPAEQASSSETPSPKLKFASRKSNAARTTPNDKIIEFKNIENEKSGKSNTKDDTNSSLSTLGNNGDYRHPFWSYLLRHHRAGSGASFVDAVDVCDKPYLDGCSVPFGAPFFFKGLFTASCFRHDICYRCGIDYDHNRLECDDAFRFNMASACTDTYLNKDVSNDNSKNNPNNNSNKSNNNSHYHDENLEPRRQNATTDVTSRLYKHRQLTVTTVNNLQKQFDKILRDKMSFFLDPSLKPRFSKNKKFTKTDFQRHAESIKFQVIKEWFKLLHKNILSMEKPNESKSKIIKKQKNVLLEVNNDDARSRSHRNKILAHHHHLLYTKCENADMNNNRKGVLRSLCKEILDEIPAQQYGTDLSSDLMIWQDLPNVIEFYLCLFFKDMYYFAVRLFGESSYQSTARSFCGESYVTDCLPDA